MKLTLGVGARSGVGIDIGSSSVKILRIHKSGSKYYASDMDVLSLPSGAVTHGIINDAATIASYIKNSFSRLGIKEKNVVISAPCRHVIIKTFEIPKMKESELDSAVFFEAQRYITYDLKEVFYDYAILNSPASNSENYSIMVVAGKKDIIDSQISLIEQCGLNPFIVDVDCIAVENMFNFNYPEEFDELTGLIRIGASEANVHILHKGLNMYRRDIPIGGVNITEEISKKFQIEFNEAENIKTGLSTKEDENFEANYSVYLTMMISRITSEIQRTIDYFAANNNKQYPRKVYLTGGSSVLTGLMSDMEAKLNLPVEYVNPFRNVLFEKINGENNKELEENARFYGIAVGLALRGVESK